jgi:hypothetical protein
VHDNLQSARRAALLAASVWLVIILYVGGSSYLIGRFQPNVVLDRDGPAALADLASRPGYDLYWTMARIWRYNWLIQPTLVTIAGLLTWSAVRRFRLARRGHATGAA